MTTPSVDPVDPIQPLANEILRRILPELNSLLREHVAAIDKPQEIIVRNQRHPDADILVELGKQHRKFEAVLSLVNIDIPVYIHGPTGSGKTWGCKMISKALQIPFYRKVVSPQSSESYIFGYKDGSGNYVPGIAYTAYSQGGLLLIDEIDNGNPSINTCIKMLTDGTECYFPCGLVERHKDFRLVANANTIGNGANMQYVGRSPQDKALLNSFMFVEWGYDRSFEKELAMKEYVNWGGQKVEEMEKAVRSFWRLRDSIDRLKINHIVSPRNLIHLARATATGVATNVIIRGAILRGMNDEQYKQIQEDVKKHRVSEKEEEEEDIKVMTMKVVAKVNNSNIDEDTPF